MATIGDLVIRLRSDATGLREGLAKGRRMLEEFGRVAGRAVIPEGSNNITAGQRMAAQMLAGLENTYLQNVRRLRQDFAEGVIDRATYRNQGRIASEQFNTGLLTGMRQIEAQGLLSPNTRAILQRNLKEDGLQASREIAEAARRARNAAATAASFDPRLGARTTAAARQADQLLKNATQAYDRTIMDLRTRLASGAISTNAFRAAATQASGVFNKSLVDGLNNIQGLASFNENVRRVIVDNFKLTGRQAANALGNALSTTGTTAGNQFARSFISNATQANRMAAVGRTASLAITAPIVAAGVATARVARSFEDSMLLLQSRTRATQAELDNLATEAKRIGAATQFTGAQVAATQASLATRGSFGVADILRETAPVVNLAASEMIELEQAASIVITTMRQFGLATSDTQRIVDIMARGASLAGANIVDFQTALRYVGPSARAAGLSLEDTVAALVALSKGGRDASMAGTTLNGMLENLQNPTRMQARFLQNNVDVLDETTGKMRPLTVILEQLRGKFDQAGLSYQQFGQRAGPGALILLEAGAAGLQRYGNILRESAGTAAEQASIRMRGMTGAFSEAQGAVENLALALGESGLVAGIVTITNKLTAFFRLLGGVPREVLATVGSLAAMAAILGPLTYLISKVVVGINVMLATMAIARSAGGIAGVTANFLSLGRVLAGGGLVLVGLAAVAGILYLVQRRAAEARKELAAYQGHLQQITTVDVAQFEMNSQMNARTRLYNEREALVRQRNEMEANRKKAEENLGRRIGKSDTQARTEAAITAVDDAIKRANSRVDEARNLYNRLAEAQRQTAEATQQITNAMRDVPPAGDDVFPIDMFGRQTTGNEIGDLVDRARFVLELFQQMESKGQDIVRPFELLTTQLGIIAVKLESIPDKLGAGADAALKLIRVQDELQTAIDEFFAKHVKAPGLTPTPPRVDPKIAPLPQTAIVEPVLPAVEIFSEVIHNIAGTLSDLEFNFNELGDVAQKAAPRFGEFLRDVGRVIGGLRAVAATIANPKNLVVGKADGSTDIFATATNVVGAVASVVGAVGVVQNLIGVFTAQAQRQAELMRENSRALTQLRLQLERDARGAGLNVDARLALNAVRPDLRGAEAASTATLFASMFTRLAAGFNITFTQLEDIARSFGITLVDNGKIVRGSLDALDAALAESAAALGRFRQTLDDQRTAQELLQNVNNVEQTPAQRIRNGLDLLAQFAPQLAERFAGLDATTEAGRTAIKAALQNLVQMIVAQGVTAEQLGRLSGLGELLTIITAVEGAFDELAEAADKVSGSLTNVPAWFRTAFRTFESALPVGVPPLAPGPLAPPTTPMPSGGGAALVIQGDVTIVAQPGETSDAAFDRWVAKNQRLARQRSLPPQDWARVAGGA